MTIDLRTILGIGLIVAGFLLPNGGSVLPVVTPSDSEQVAQFYDALAVGVEHDGEKPGEKFYTSTLDFALAHANALRLWRDTNKVGTVPGLGDAVDKVFSDALGDEVQPVTDEVRKRLVEACHEVARRLRDGTL